MDRLIIRFEYLWKHSAELTKEEERPKVCVKSERNSKRTFVKISSTKKIK
jgi:hypothetical protein